MEIRFLIIIGVFALVMIPVSAKSFAEESFNGYSSIDPLLSEIVSGQSTTMNIRFFYISGPYGMNNFTPIIEVNPSSAGKFIQVNVDPIEIKQGQIQRIPVVLTLDPHVDHEKIFLSISFAGNHFITDELQKSSWNDQVVLDVIVNDELIPEPEQDRPIYENCGPGTILESGICTVEKETDVVYSDVKWESSVKILKQLSPLKQIKNGIALFDVICPENKIMAYKNDNMNVACVTEETYSELISRGWALLRFAMPGENPSNVLCNRYDGKWHSKYEGCRGDITDLQCSLMGGKFVDDLKICYNEICPVNKTYTLCVTNPDLISGEKENEN